MADDVGTETAPVDGASSGRRVLRLGPRFFSPSVPSHLNARLRTTFSRSSPLRTPRMRMELAGMLRSIVGYGRDCTKRILVAVWQEEVLVSVGQFLCSRVVAVG